MTNENRKKNIALEVAHGREALQAAEVLLAASLFRDAVSRAYYAAFHFACALLLTLGILGYQYHRLARWRGLILLVAVAATLALASHATDRYWKMTDAFGFGNCFPDASDCAPIPPSAPAWWALMFGF